MNNPTNNEQTPPKLSVKKQAIALLSNEGLKNREIAQTLGISDARVTQIKHELKKYNLEDKKIVKLAHKAVKSLIKGEPVGTADKVKDSTVLAAAQMIYDRVQPVVKQNMNMNINQSFIDITVDNYQE